MTCVISDNPNTRLRWRNIETACERCHGAGGYWYGSTALWRKGMVAGCALTWGVCDHCWGSGDQNHRWTDLQEMDATQAERVAAGAMRLLERRLGVDHQRLHPAIELVCKLLDKEANRRKPPTGETWWDAYHWRLVCTGLAKVLREMVKAKQGETHP